MNWKEFLKPDLKKIILTLVLFFLFVYYVAQVILCLLVAGSPCPDYLTILIRYLPFIIALYLFSCLIIFIYNKIKR